MNKALCLLLTIGTLCVPAALRAFPLVENGAAGAKVCFKKDAPGDVQDAATELARVIEKMSGAKLAGEAVPDGQAAPAGPGIVLGALAEEMGLRVEKPSRARDGFRYKVRGNKLLIVGEQAGGVYTGAVRFLESLGCGWYVPGDMGEVIPRRTTIVVAEPLDVTGVSDSINRRFWYGGKNSNGPATDAWLRRTNGGNYQSGSWNHAYGGLIPPEVMKQHPEYGSLNRGQRTTKQLCTTNPGVIQTAAATLVKNMEKSPRQLVFAAGPNDGGNLCECPECAKLDTAGYVEPSSGKPAGSDRVFLFASNLADLTAKTFPDRDLGILVYSEYSRIPRKITRMDPHVFPMIAPIRRCRIHGPGNPCCEMSKLFQDEIRGWSKLGSKLGFYVYNYNLADSLLPLSKVDFYKRIVGEVKQADIEQLAWIFETIDSWSMHAPSLYLSARLSWNCRLDVDEEMDRFYKGFYGSASGPMKSYWTRLDKVYATTACHTGSSYGMHKFWTPEVLRASRADLDEAGRLAADPREREAVAMAEAGLRCAEMFVRIWNAVRAFDFAIAAATQQQLQAHCQMMAAKPDPHWAHLRYAYDQYYRRMVGSVVEAGNQVLTAGGKIVVKLPEVWKFAVDTDRSGMKQGWFKPDFDASAWKDMGTMLTSWADEGLTWYQGDAWYRTVFDLPAGCPDKDVHLWFGGFDHNVDVYLNGHCLGEKLGFMKPQAFENIGRFLKPGAKNILAVRVSAGSLAEIGTGGIMMPVMIYRGPVAGDAGRKPVGKAYEF